MSHASRTASEALANALRECEGENVPELAILAALRVTQGDREDTYDHPFWNFINTAIEWTKDAYDYGEFDADSDRIFTPYSVARKMTLLKKARLSSSEHFDGDADYIGYLSCKSRIATYLVKNGFVVGTEDAKATWTAALTYFDRMTPEELNLFYRKNKPKHH